MFVHIPFSSLLICALLAVGVFLCVCGWESGASQLIYYTDWRYCDHVVGLPRVPVRSVEGCTGEGNLQGAGLLQHSHLIKEI